MARTLVLNSGYCQFTGERMGKCFCNSCVGLARNNEPDEDDADDADDDEMDDGTAASKAAAYATLRADPNDAVAKRHCMDALQCAGQGDHDAAAETHLKAAQRLRAKADAAMDPNSDVGGKGITDRGLRTKYLKAVKTHEQAAEVHQNLTDGNQDAEGEDDDAVENRRRVAQLERNLRRKQRVAVRNARRRSAPVVNLGHAVGVGDVLEVGRPSMRNIVANQRRSENKRSFVTSKGLVCNYADGGNSPYAQYNLPQSPLDRGRALQGSGYNPSFASDIESAGFMGSGPRSPNPGAGDDQYDLPRRSVMGTDGPRGTPGLQLLDPWEQGQVDRMMAERLGLDYDPDDAYQLTTPRTMQELLDRETKQGHSVSGRSVGTGRVMNQLVQAGVLDEDDAEQALGILHDADVEDATMIVNRRERRRVANIRRASGGDPDLLVLPTFNAREAQALQRRFDRPGRR